MTVGHLGGAIGRSDFRKVYATEKVNNWCKEISKLSEFTKTQPHAAYLAFCHGEVHKFTYFLEQFLVCKGILNHLII